MATAALGILLMPIVNVERWAEARGWDKLLVNVADSETAKSAGPRIMSWAHTLIEARTFWWTFGVLLGVSATLWLSEFFAARQRRLAVKSGLPEMSPIRAAQLESSVKQAFTSDPVWKHEPNYKLWMMMEHWTVSAASSILVGVDPNRIYSGPRQSDMNMYLQLMLQALRKRELRPRGMGRSIENGTPVAPIDVIEWAEKGGLEPEITKKLRDAIPTPSGESGTQ